MNEIVRDGVRVPPYTDPDQRDRRRGQNDHAVQSSECDQKCIPKNHRLRVKIEKCLDGRIGCVAPDSGNSELKLVNVRR